MADLYKWVKPSFSYMLQTRRMGRSPCCEKVGLKKGPWTPEEDQKLLAYVEEHGCGNWRALPSKAGLERCGKSCRLRWTNYLRPDIKRGKFTLQEEQTIIQLHALLGNRWSAIATHLPKRTDNEIKNYWNTHLKKRLAKMGIDPVTHKPKSDALLTCSGESRNAATLSHTAQWESARLEAEARLARQSKSQSQDFITPSLPQSTIKTRPTKESCGEETKGYDFRSMPEFDSQPIGSFVEGFTDLLLAGNVSERSLSFSSSDGEDCYWNSIHHPVNASPSNSISPLFW